MASTQARAITSNQSGVHNDLLKLVSRHKQNELKRPIAQHTREAFSTMLDWLATRSGDLVIDACCGVGESTYRLAKMHPNANVIGIDKSIARIEKHSSYTTLGTNAQTNSLGQAIENTTVDETPSNYLLVQANLEDFWRLLLAYIKTAKPSWKVIKQYILYPNPYPKKTQLGKRWHASALLPTVIAVCPNIEIRSNWRIYVEEFLIAVSTFDATGDITNIHPNSFKLSEAFTPFERKYLASGQICFKSVIRPLGSDKK